ncbi:MAG: hypothetical protein LLG97_03440 [Deltaproteobacteria bacterium]|nr:hypothetical protein [Deltaproteobacteria bacterium]
MGKNMSSPELLKDLLVTILSMQKVLQDPENENFRGAQEAYLKLLDGFYEEFQDMMAPQQYDAAKVDSDYFVALIQLAYYYQNNRESMDGLGERTEPDWKLFTRC